jgi:hypothetical protein
VYFAVQDIGDLNDLLYWFDGCHCGHYDWRVFVETDCMKGRTVFTIEGPVGGYDEANTIAALIMEWKRQTAGQPKITKEERISIAELAPGLMFTHQSPAYLGYFPIGKPLIGY